MKRAWRRGRWAGAGLAGGCERRRRSPLVRASVRRPMVISEVANGGPAVAGGGGGAIEGPGGLAGGRTFTPAAPVLGEDFGGAAVRLEVSADRRPRRHTSSHVWRSRRSTSDLRRNRSVGSPRRTGKRD